MGNVAERRRLGFAVPRLVFLPDLALDRGIGHGVDGVAFSEPLMIQGVKRDLQPDAGSNIAGMVDGITDCAASTCKAFASHSEAMAVVGAFSGISTGRRVALAAEHCLGEGFRAGILGERGTGHGDVPRRAS